MSGHSKWSTIKRKKGASDAKRGQLFTKLAKEIAIAAKDGADPDVNFKLRLVIDKAKAANMPKDNIERAIRRGAGLEKGSELEEITYEGYGPHGVALIIEVVTDNRNRAVADLRRWFTKLGGSLGEAGCVAWQFESRGYLTLEPDGPAEEHAPFFALQRNQAQRFVLLLDTGRQHPSEIFTGQVPVSGFQQQPFHRLDRRIELDAGLDQATRLHPLLTTHLAGEHFTAPIQVLVIDLINGRRPEVDQPPDRDQPE